MLSQDRVVSSREGAGGIGGLLSVLDTNGTRGNATLQRRRPSQFSTGWRNTLIAQLAAFPQKKRLQNRPLIDIIPAVPTGYSVMLSHGHGSKRPRKQEQAIAALLECATIKQAAENVGLSERTLRTWLKIPEFRDAYLDARRACVDQAVSRLEGNFEFPVAVLEKIAGDLSVPAYARVSAAKGLLEAGFKAVELFDVTERLRRIEERLGPESETFKPTLVPA